MFTAPYFAGKALINNTTVVEEKQKKCPDLGPLYHDPGALAVIDKRFDELTGEGLFMTRDFKPGSVRVLKALQISLTTIYESALNLKKIKKPWIGDMMLQYDSIEDDEFIKGYAKCCDGIHTLMGSGLIVPLSKLFAINIMAMTTDSQEQKLLELDHNSWLLIDKNKIIKNDK